MLPLLAFLDRLGRGIQDPSLWSVLVNGKRLETSSLAVRWVDDRLRLEFELRGQRVSLDFVLSLRGLGFRFDGGPLRPIRAVRWVPQWFRPAKVRFDLPPVPFQTDSIQLRIELG